LRQTQNSKVAPKWGQAEEFKPLEGPTYP